jgi:hypothetical protein
MNYSTNYLQNRQNPNLPIDELERALQAICQHFDKSWLESSQGTHRLQHLWSRKDALSTNELFIFGQSLCALDKINREWLNHQVNLITRSDKNNQNGAIFEIIGINFFCCKNQTVIPANIAQKGYDAELQFMNSFHWKLSLKSHGKSDKEKEFRQNIESIYQEIFVPLIKKKSLNIQIGITAVTFPTPSDWKQLRSSLEGILNLFSGRFIQREISKCWSISLSFLPTKSEDGRTFSQIIPSYSLIATAPFYEGEQKRLISKLKKAISKCEKHIHSDDKSNLFIFMRLHPTASVEILKKWTEEYFEKNSETILNGVLFWQPYIAQDIQNLYVIVNYVDSCFSANLETPRLEFPVGIITTDSPPSWQLTSDQNKIELRGNYVFQKGDHYVLMQPSDNSYFGPPMYQQGIHTHAVYPHDLGNLVVSGIFGEELCLIGG